MNLRRFYQAALATLAAELVLAAWGLAVTGTGASVPIHWNVAGEADGFAPAAFAFALTPLITLALAGLFAIIPRIEPRRANLDRSATAYRTVAIGMLMLMLLVQAGTVLAGTGHPLPMAALLGGGAGVLFALIGNVLTTVRSNFMFGIRTPWTLSSDLAWDRTHRLVGRLFVVTGIATALLALTGRPVLTMAVLLGGVVLVLVVSVVYSYRVWRSDPNRRSIGDAS